MIPLGGGVLPFDAALDIAATLVIADVHVTMLSSADEVMPNGSAACCCY